MDSYQKPPNNINKDQLPIKIVLEMHKPLHVNIDSLNTYLKYIQDFQTSLRDFADAVSVAKFDYPESQLL